MQKDSRQRLGDIHDMRLALDGAFETTPGKLRDIAGRAGRRRLAAFALAAAIAGGGVGGLLFWTWRAPPAAEVVRVALTTSEDQPIRLGDRIAHVTNSPDGRHIVYLTPGSGRDRSARDQPVANDRAAGQSRSV